MKQTEPKALKGIRRSLSPRNTTKQYHKKNMWIPTPKTALPQKNNGAKALKKGIGSGIKNKKPTKAEVKICCEGQKRAEGANV